MYQNKYLAYINIPSPHYTPHVISTITYPHFTDEETAHRRGK